MGAGRWVFPIAIFGFIIFIAGYLASTPVTPAPAIRYCDVGELCVGVGDIVTLEHIEYYNETEAFVSYTSREDLFEAGKLKQGRVPTELEPRLIQYRIPPEVATNASHPFRGMLDLKPGASFTSEKIPDLYGRWANTTTIPLNLLTLGVSQTWRDGDVTALGTRFNYTASTELWAVQLGQPPAVNDVVPCESGARGFPWNCRITALNPSNRTLTFQRQVREGDNWLPIAFFRFDPSTPVPNVNVTVKMQGANRFNLNWPLTEGDTFTIAEPRPGYPTGAYEVLSVTGDSARAHYAPLRSGPTVAHLIGETVWWDFTIVDIQRS